MPGAMYRRKSMYHSVPKYRAVLIIYKYTNDPYLQGQRVTPGIEYQVRCVYSKCTYICAYMYRVFRIEGLYSLREAI